MDSRRHIFGSSLALSLLLLISACGGGGGTSAATSGSAVSAAQVSSSSASRAVTQTDAEIAALIYSDSQRVPADFYVEAPPVVSGYVATSHLKSTDLSASAATQYELCSDDFNQALQWSEAANSNGVNADLVGNDTTDRYFEFDRVRNNTTPQAYLRTRIYKCAYLDRTGVDLSHSQGDAGVLNVRPLDASALKGLSEYLWQFTSYNNYGNVVLSSSGNASGTTLTHSLVIASLLPAASGCDSINVIEWKHTLEVTTGALRLSVTSLWSFHAQYSQGAVSVCAS